MKRGYIPKKGEAIVLFACRVGRPGVVEIIRGDVFDVNKDVIGVSYEHGDLAVQRAYLGCFPSRHVEFFPVSSFLDDDDIHSKAHRFAQLYQAYSLSHTANQLECARDALENAEQRINTLTALDNKIRTSPILADWNSASRYTEGDQ